MSGIFTVSLDFELYWGVRDKRTIAGYEANLRGVRKAVPAILQAFSDYGIHATWAVLGFLYFRDADELKRNLPTLKPAYDNPGLSPYGYIEEADSLDPDLHFAPDLIEMIRNTPGQEIGTHTFSHFYGLENGQNAAAFRADINKAIEIARDRGLTTKSMVSPRNQWNPDYLPILGEAGIQCFRGCQQSWLYKTVKQQDETRLRRALRLVDAYVNLSGHHTYELHQRNEQEPINIPASRFLRPYNKKLAALDGLRLRRIKKVMDHAASNNEIFHLWWHPHNFGTSTAQNIGFLKKVLAHFVSLRNKHDFKTMNMSKLTDLAEAGTC